MKNCLLKFKVPAVFWEERFPIGNGSLGAMLDCGIGKDSILLNKDTLWSGNGRDKNNKEGKNYVQQIKTAMLAGDVKLAESLIAKYQLGEWTENYLPFGELEISCDMTDDGSYVRALDMSEAVATAHSADAERRYFCSFPDNVLVAEYKFATARDMSIAQKCEMPFTTRGGDAFVFEGQAPSFLLPVYHDAEKFIDYDEKNHGMRFMSALKAVSDGDVVYKDDCVEIKGATSVTLFFAAETTYEKKKGFDGVKLCIETVDKAVKKGVEKIIEDHISDFKRLFDTASIDLGGDGTTEISMKTLKKFHKSGKGGDIPEAVFNFGRYLLISSSRKGTLPANLQGIWNSKMRAPWSSNYTVNINTEMNYWPAEVTGLGECHEALLDFIGDMVENGRKTAKEVHGLDGWVSHHNTDAYHHTSPVGGSSGVDGIVYGYFPMSSGWLCSHLYEHYLFTEDTDYLKNYAYPIMKEAAKFYEGYLTEIDGVLTTVPSTSPEHSYIAKNGERHSAAIGSAMDLAIIRTLFYNLHEAAHVLGDTEIHDRCEEILNAVQQYKIDEYGCIQEWSDVSQGCEKHHRHISHLYGLYPEREITPENTPIWAQAAKNSLDRRGDKGTGWSMAWKICARARLHDGKRALKLIKMQLKPLKTKGVVFYGGGTYPNLFCAHPPFQIDGNFGITAGIAEMLIQSHLGYVCLLPALPEEWANGSFSGLKARGNFIVDCKWANGKVTEFMVKSPKKDEVKVFVNGADKIYKTNEKIML